MELHILFKNGEERTISISSDKMPEKGLRDVMVKGDILYCEDSSGRCTHLIRTSDVAYVSYCED